MNSTLDNEKVREMFEKYDLNRNGVLEEKEFYELMGKILREMGENFPDKKHSEIVEEGIKQFDLNKNGKIEYNEFYQFMCFIVMEKGYTFK